MSISREIKDVVGCLVYIKRVPPYNMFINPIRIVGFNMKTIPKPLVLVNQWTIVLSVIVALLTQSAWILLLPLITGLMSLFTGFHPIMALSKRLLTKPLNEYVQEDYDQLQFNQGMAVVFLTVATISFFLGWSMLFNIATVLVGLAALIAILGFCVGCFIRFQYQQWMYRRKKSVM